jgi:hypothetical protein
MLYKYRDWQNAFHKRILTHNELYFASPAEINDPFDFKIEYDFDLLDTIEKKIAFVEKIAEDTTRFALAREIDIKAEKERLLWRLTNERDKVEEQYNSTNHFASDQRFGVVSLSEIWDNLLLWSHYANCHKGFCVGFDREKLKNSDFVSASSQVAYYEQIPQISPLEKDIMWEIFLKTCSKAKDWSYEREVRLIKLWDDPVESKRRVVELPDGYIKEVTLGMAINEKSKKDIVEICKENHIIVYQSIRSRKKFSLERHVL